MSEKKPTPVLRRSDRTCPVCGHRSYSAGGIHPQCAMKQADARIVRVPPPKVVKAPPRQRSWSKKCPKCEAMTHVRTLACPCGYKWPKN